MTLASVALSAGGAYYNGQTQANYVDAVNRANKDAYDMARAAREAERVRQDGLEASSGEAFNEALASMDRASEDAATEAATADFVDTLNNLQTVTAGEQGFLLPGQGESSVAVKDWVARSAHDAAQDAGRRIQALARLTGAGGSQGARINTVRSAGDTVGVNNGIRRGSLGVNQFEQNIPAATVTPGSTLIGDIMSGIGSLAGAGVLGGGLLPGAAGAATQGTIFDLYSDPMFNRGGLRM
jgi:hypothetical protein